MAFYTLQNKQFKYRNNFSVNSVAYTPPPSPFLKLNTLELNNLIIDNVNINTGGSVTNNLVPITTQSVSLTGSSSQRFSTLQPGQFIGQELWITKDDTAQVWPPYDSQFSTCFGVNTGKCVASWNNYIIVGGNFTGIRNPVNATDLTNSTSIALFNLTTLTWETAQPTANATSSTAGQNPDIIHIKPHPSIADTFILVGKYFNTFNGTTVGTNACLFNASTKVFTPFLVGATPITMGAAIDVIDVIVDVPNNIYYFAGAQTTTSGTTTNRITKYDGNALTVSALMGGSGGAAGIVRCLAPVYVNDNPTLDLLGFYIGGSFANLQNSAGTTILGTTKLGYYTVFSDTLSVIPGCTATALYPVFGGDIYDMYYSGSLTNKLYFVGSFTFVSLTVTTNLNNYYRTAIYDATAQTFSRWGAGFSSGTPIQIIKTTNNMFFVIGASLLAITNPSIQGDNQFVPIGGAIGSTARTAAIYNPTLDRFIPIANNFGTNSMPSYNGVAVITNNYLAIAASNFPNMLILDLYKSNYIIGTTGAELRYQQEITSTAELNVNINYGSPVVNDISCWILSGKNDNVLLKWNGTNWITIITNCNRSYYPPPTTGW
jgi:hypothetical protein